MHHGRGAVEEGGEIVARELGRHEADAGALERPADGGVASARDDLGAARGEQRHDAPADSARRAGDDDGHHRITAPPCEMPAAEPMRSEVEPARNRPLRFATASACGRLEAMRFPSVAKTSTMRPRSPPKVRARCASAGAEAWCGMTLSIAAT